ncbi:transducin (beta)-like 1 [Nematocida sp. ERTm5]|nr:transducin (beta)-like 1 [Nematocida sp. ERTm5]
MITLTSTELNYLVYRYLIEEGYVHSAYVFGHETMIEDNPSVPQLQRDALKNYVIKGVEMEYVEKHSNMATGIRKCTSKYSISTPHMCIEQEIEIHPIYLDSQESDVSLCAWAENGEMVTGSQNCLLRLWNLPNVKKEWRVGINQNNAHGITGVAIESDSPFGDSTRATTIVGATHSGELFVTKNEKEWKALHGHRGPIVAVSLKGNELLTGGWDGLCKKWTIENNSLVDVKTWPLHKGAIMDILSLDPGIITCSADGTLSCINKYPSDGQITKLSGHDGEINSIVEMDGRIISCSDDTKLKIWQFNKKEPLNVLNGHTQEVYSVSVAKNIFASGSFDATIGIWSPERSEALNFLIGHEKPIYTVDFSKDQTLLASGGLDPVAKLWDIRSNELVKEFDIGAAIYQIKFSPTNNSLLVCSSDPRPIILDIRK